MTKRELIDYCLTFPDGYEDYPFDDVWVAMRHRTGNRTFAFIFERAGELCVNVKCEPMEGDFLKRAVEWAAPAYHMNKRHWITARVERCAEQNELSQLCGLIAESYRLTKKQAGGCF